MEENITQLIQRLLLEKAEKTKLKRKKKFNPLKFFATQSSSIGTKAIK